MRSLFFTAIFLGSFLVFLIQPMLSKILLPLVGGAPAIWIVSVLFFQLLLLGGYAYSALTSAYMKPKTQATTHTALMLVAILLYIPIKLNTPLDFNETQPEIWTIVTLLLTIGMPYFLLTANATLIQRWYHDAFKSSPYFLFSISNIGSLAGLLSFPFLIEWMLTIKHQTYLWNIAFIALFVLFLIITLKTYKIEGNTKNEDLGKNIKLKQIITVVFLGFIPSSLFLSTSLYITTDVGSLPLLWVIPLAIYLISFIIAFSEKAKFYITLSQKLHPVAILVSIVLTTLVTGESAVFLSILAGYFICQLIISTSCHGRVANEKPEPKYLTAFYFWLSVGGALGGLFNVIAPYIFNSIIEHFIVLLLSILAVMSGGKKKVDLLSQLSNKKNMGKNIFILIFFVAMAIVVLIPSDDIKEESKKVMFADRNFFGKLTVAQDKLYWEDNDIIFRKINHNTTMHGLQIVEGGDNLHIASYYTPVKKLLANLPDEYFTKPFGILGLGAGVGSCFGKEGQKIDFFEINQMVIDVAKNPDYFSYIRDCKTEVSVIKGDGRLKINEQEAHKYNMLMVDVFTSDAVPVHLITKEAIDVYLNKISTETGFIIFNISNRHLDFSHILSRIAKETNLNTAVMQYESNPDIALDLASRWLILYHDDFLWKDNILEHGEVYNGNNDTPLWTDDYSNILAAIK